MTTVEIQDKLGRFLDQHLPMAEECHAVYLMVEARKILEHYDGEKRPKDFQILRFYCDWTLHTKKSGITDEIREVMRGIYGKAKADIENQALRQSGGAIRDFLYMENLRDELAKFIETLRIDARLVKDENWISFVSQLVRVLSDQPIENPIPEITQALFLPAADRCVWARIVFANPVGGKTHYDAKNAY